MDAAALEVLDRIHEMYSRSWDQLLAIVAILAVLLGGIVPFWIQWAQRRLFKAEQQELELSIQEGITAATRDLEEQLKQTLTDELESGQTELRTSVKRSASLLEGHSLFLQGQLLLLNRQPVLALSIFIGSAKEYLTAKEEYRLQCTFLNIKLASEILTRNPVLPPGAVAMGEPGGSDRDRIDGELESKFKSLIGRLKDANTDSRYTLEIDAMQTAFRAAVKARDKYVDGDGKTSAESEDKPRVT